MIDNLTTNTEIEEIDDILNIFKISYKYDIDIDNHTLIFTFNNNIKITMKYK